ncbi:NADH-ubiquinone oxidoreductase 213 kDa subunit [Sphaerulina musiva SO2202]|uniref:NADH-ubiquinone oxidoreductase 213 kDa subunit n=1 Tax=Sphaerulina musiva (strain SO2202) TaxID=692275 RepID=M3CYB2_SPHMS|nr:NADH-ubiquinone oxidoreductase 213 kDa subunit [Sphaerulina musiva SO2202]EMF08676.1 NADH-ubiquinone oxidoreductase 213 kDa subunit [Sphaerulina musiva SO2202]
MEEAGHIAAQALTGNHTEEDSYHPRDAVGSTIKATLTTGTGGAFVSAIQNTLTKQNVGAWGVFTRTGGTVATFAAMGGAYEFFKSASANLRQKEDTYNYAIGGAFAGAMLGLRFRSAPAVLGYGTATAVIIAAFQYTGGHMLGAALDPDVDEVARKEYMRKNRRRDIGEIVNELGEGRGIVAPGYAERRAARLKEAYGIDVVHSPTVPGQSQ